MDNGTELTAHAMIDWCRLARVKTAFIDPGSPWQNGYSESFNGLGFPPNRGGLRYAASRSGAAVFS